MDTPRSPQFQTNPPSPAEVQAQAQQIWKFKVASTSTGGDSALLTCNLCYGDGSVVGSRQYVVKQASSSAHSVGDVLMACRPLGGTGKANSSVPVYFEELAGGGGLPPGTGQYKVLQLIDNGNPGTPDWDWVRWHA